LTDQGSTTFTPFAALPARPAALLVRGGEVLSAGPPAAGTRAGAGKTGGAASGPRRADVLVVDGVIAAVGPDLDAPAGASVLDAGGCLVTPGLVDLHTHLRQPGGEDAETIESGTRAAALGGYTAVVAMPNTSPAVDCAAVVREVLELGHGALAEVAVAGAITVGRKGEALAPLAEMAGLGVRLFTDDGRGVQDGGLLRRALEYAGPLGIVLAEHCEDDHFAAGGAMHEGPWSSRLGLPGQPALAEEAMLARDLALVRLTGSPMHFLHLSTVGSLRLLAAARAEGLPVTAEVTPHHLALCDALAATYDPLFRVNPPLRSAADAAALRRALAEGLLDAVATDHAPHTHEDKEEPFEAAPPGMLGLETALAVVWSHLAAGAEPPAPPAWARRNPARVLVGAAAPSGPASGRASGASGAGGACGAGTFEAPGPADGDEFELEHARPGLPWLGELLPEDDVAARRCSPADLLERMSAAPARIAGLEARHGGPVAVGRPANLCVFDPAQRWTVDPERSASRSRNTPFAGWSLSGKVLHTVLAGEPVVVDGEAQR
jgi:dihydroorotase